MKLTSPFVLIGIMAAVVAIAAAVSYSGSLSKGPASAQPAPTDAKDTSAAARPEIVEPALDLTSQEDAPVEAEEVDPRIAEAEGIVRELLKDPMSAQFRRTSVHPGPSRGSTVVCGEVNGKNSFGGYIGFNQFSVIYEPGQAPSPWVDEPKAELAAILCKAVGFK